MSDRSRRPRPRSGTRLVAGLFAVATAGLLGAGCGSGDGAAAGGAPQGPRKMTVEVADSTIDTLRVRINAVGTLEADALVEVRPEVSGVITRIPVEEGQSVARGQVLMTLEDRETRAQADAAAAAESRARTEAANLAQQLERNRGLLASGAISQQAFDDIESGTEAAQAREKEAAANLALARRRLDKSVVRAPFAGRIDAKEVYVGDFVELGKTTLFTLVDDDPLKVEFAVPEQYIDRLEEGSTVAVRVRNRPEESFTGTVVFVSPRVDPVNRTVTLKAEVPNPDGTLRAGQFADVELVLEEIPNALLVPESAIVSREGESFLFVVANGVAERRSVRLGEREPGRVQVLEGVAEGETVVVAGQQRIQDGTPVDPLGDAGEGG